MKRFVWSIVLMAVTLIMCGCEKDYYEAAPEEMITYTSTDGKAIELDNYDLDECDARVIANFYQDGVGYVLFDKPVTDVSGLFRLSYNVLSVTLPHGLQTIGYEMFCSCSSLTKVVIPSSVTEIEDAAFENCISLTSVTIPNSVTEIGNWAFSNCYELKIVYCKPTTPPTMVSYSQVSSSHAFDDNVSGRKIYVPRASVDKYKSADGWSRYASDIVGYDF